MHVLVTGCSSGIGLSICRHLLDQGHEVTGLSRRSPPIESGNFNWVKADLSALASTPLELDSGSFDAFVHAAGIMHTGDIQAYEHELAQQMWRLHVDAPALLVKKLLAEQAPLKRIILIGSRTQQGALGKSAYAASKAAQQGLVRSWALELMAGQTTVNLIAPGATRTPMLEDPNRQGVAPKLPPMGRFIEPEEIAASVSFLLDEQARSITGQTLTVCAGASL
ncbi:NAD(P)-dependent dehydrogenase (short-subunit alcohol dehydrogenase family) [Vreelandella songnenensis]|uniref:NAD(P)-dependent dehydrogenase (Short-subunit alcohol dehydrogenase family) n=1 Tax=Vreelandella songnenensis TaxID=1176243 RepID=A0A2T0V7S8_9GAMM|nr:SDR family oxidoreductase [Halomonas songnenensis]PRY66201.1 NAD(P)-dependent dehydrogenase (short-subunit alcohol dehydrogenase family) [Halomonas songnenensis]